MDQAALPVQIGDSQSESVGSSRSLLESVGSIESWKLRPTPTPNPVDVERSKLSPTPTRNAEVRFSRPGKKSPTPSPVDVERVHVERWKLSPTPTRSVHERFSKPGKKLRTPNPVAVERVHVDRQCKLSLAPTRNAEGRFPRPGKTLPTPDPVDVESVHVERWKLSPTTTRSAETRFPRPGKKLPTPSPVDVDRCKLSPTSPRNAEVRFPRPGKKSSPDRQLMHFSKALPDVPVQVVWDMVSDHKNLTPLVPGVMDSFDYIEGEGRAGSIYVAVYSPKSVIPGERKYVMNEVQVRDEASKLYVVKSVGGKYQQRYTFYKQYIKVHADEVLGASTTVVECHLEFELRNQSSPPPVDSGNIYMLVMGKVRDRYQIMNRVERPVTVVINISKRLRLHGGQRLLPGGDEQEPEDRLDRRRRKPKVQVVLIDGGEDEAGDADEDQHSRILNNERRPQILAQIQKDEKQSRNQADGQQSHVQVQDEEGSDPESQKTQRSGKKISRYYHQSAASGLVIRRKSRR